MTLVSTRLQVRDDKRATGIITMIQSQKIQNCLKSVIKKGE